MLRMNVVFKLIGTLLLQPRPGDDAPILDPESDLPLLLAALVLAQAGLLRVTGRPASHGLSRTEMRQCRRECTLEVTVWHVPPNINVAVWVGSSVGERSDDLDARSVDRGAKRMP